MIFGFENETAPLNDIEKKAAKIIAGQMVQWHTGSDKSVTAQQISNGMAQCFADFRDGNGRPYLNGARVRKIVNYIRTSGLCPRLIASSKGYYVSNDRNELNEYITGLYARANAIKAVANAMEAGL